VVEKPRTWRSAAHSPTLAYHEEQVRRWATRRSDLPVVNGQVSRDGQASPWGAVLGLYPAIEIILRFDHICAAQQRN